MGYNDGTVTACYWSDSPDTGIGNGTGEATKVTGGDWTEAITRMNTALSGTGWKSYPATTACPYWPQTSKLNASLSFDEMSHRYGSTCGKRGT